MRLLRWTIGLLLGALLLTSCSTADDSAGADSAPQQGSQDEGGAADDAGGGSGAGDGAGLEGQPDAGPEVITTGSLRMVVDDAGASADEMVRIVEAAGGRVDERAERRSEGEGEPPSAWLTVRIPSSELTATLAELEALGDVEELSLSAQNVTRESRDLDARIRALETSAERLLALMADAESNADLLAAESALSERQSELESLQAQRSLLSDQVALATLEISLAAEGEPVQLEPGGFLGGLASGWAALVSFLSGLLVVLGVMLPWLLVLAVVAVVALPLVRRRRRRAGKGADAAAGAGTAPAPGNGSAVTMGAPSRAPAAGAGSPTAPGTGSAATVGAPPRAPADEPRTPDEDVRRA